MNLFIYKFFIFRKAIQNIDRFIILRICFVILPKNWSD